MVAVWRRDRPRAPDPSIYCRTEPTEAITLIAQADTSPVLNGDLLFLGYVVLFATAALVCFASVSRARRIRDTDTRHGIVALLLTSGGWAAFHVGFLVAPTPELQAQFYVLGLVVGLATVGPWLYFCSAYTGRSLHRNRTIQRLAVTVFLTIVALKVTNPFHNLYFTATVTTVPFHHLAIESGVLHWSVMGMSYALATVGYFVLLELFMRVGHDTKPVAVLLGLTGLPIVLDLIGTASPYLIDITYEPLGVAAFSLGILFVYRDRFEAIQLAGDSDDPVIVVTAENRIRDYNVAAGDLFPELLDRRALGRSLDAVLSTDADLLAGDGSIIELQRRDSTRYYRLTTTSFGGASASNGRTLTLTDVTHRERYRRELERQNERLDQFASLISHDLRNPLNVAAGRLDLARQDLDDENLAVVADAHERMEVIIEDVLTLARQGQPIDETEPVDLLSVAEDAWHLVDTADADLVTDGDVTFQADRDRLQQLLENLFRNALDHVGPDVTVTVGPLPERDGFVVADDGPGIPAADREAVFESGYTTAEDGTGFGLAIVGEIAEAHGWEIAATEGPGGGARFEITGVDAAT